MKWCPLANDQTGLIMANSSRPISCNQQLKSFTGDTDNISVSSSSDCVHLNETLSDDNSPFFFYEKEQLAFLWILLILIVVGNSAVLVGLSFSKARKSRMNYFIKHLAVADLTVGVISVLTDIVWKITVSWHAGNIACKIIRFSQALVTYSSTYVLVALSIDRYDAICHPMNFSRGWRRARILVFVAWLLSAVFSIPSLMLYEESWIQDQTTQSMMLQCWIDLPYPWQWQVYITLIAVGLFFLPAIIISACYVVIVRTIWAQSVALTTTSPSSNRARQKGTPSDLDEDQDSRRASSRGIIPRAKIKTVKMTFVIVSVFILCWSPYIVFDMLQVYDFLPKSKTMTAVATFVQSLAPLNSAANPLIYCLFSTHLCKNLRKIPAVQWITRKTSGVRRHFKAGNTCASNNIDHNEDRSPRRQVSRKAAPAATGRRQATSKNDQSKCLLQRNDNSTARPKVTSSV